MELPLFPNDQFPIFRERESLYSWCARIHQLSGNNEPCRTSYQLFGERKSGLRADFPTPLDTLVRQVGDVLGDIDSVLRDRTLYGFYANFLPLDRRADLALAIKHGPYSRVHYALGLSTGPALIYRALKCCRFCQEDATDVAGGWWRIDQQWPATFVCPKHDRLLDSVDVEWSRYVNARWLLPQHVLKTGLRKLPGGSHIDIVRLRQISQWCQDLLSVPGLDLQTKTLRYCYLSAAKQRGYLAMDGGLRLRLLRDDWLNWSVNILDLPELQFAREVSGVNAGFLGQLVRSYAGVRHPLKHFLLLAFLFESQAEFAELNKQISQMLHVEGEASVQLHLRDLRGRFQTLVSDHGLSVNAAAAEVGIHTSQAIKYLKAAQIAYAQRPRIVGTEKEKRLVELLKQGTPRKTICLQLNIRSSFIKDFLAKRGELKSHYHAAVLESARESHRVTFLRITEENPSLALKDIRRLPRNGYQWLYKHDSAWLRAMLPSLWRS